MRLEDLEYFVAIAEEEHIGRAALRLGVSQPALSKAVQRLERDLGFALFDRHPKGVALTTLAKSFYQRIRLVRIQLQDAVDEASEMHLGRIGVLRVGVAPAYTDFPFSHAAQQLRAQRPAVRMQVSVNLNDALVASLLQGHADLVICGMSNSFPPGLRQTPLFPDDLCIVARKGHPLLARKRLKLQDLVDASWVLIRTSVVARRNVEARWSERGLPPPRVAIEVDSSAVHLRELIRRSDLLTLMGESDLRSDLGRGLAPLPLDDARWTRMVGYMTRENSYLPPLAERFIELLVRVCATEQAREGPGAAIRRRP